MSTSSLIELVCERILSLHGYSAVEAHSSVKLDANESPWPLSREIQHRLSERLSSLPFHRYPDPSCLALKEAIANTLGARPEELVLGVGSDEVICLLLMTFSRARESKTAPAVLYPTPTFVMFRLSSIARGFETIEVPLDDRWEIEHSRWVDAIQQEKPNLIFLPMPNNPTGNEFDHEQIEKVILAASDSLVVVDEAYSAFSGISHASWFHQFPNVALMGTLSKIGFAALRVGWARLRPELVEQVEKIRQPYNLNSLSQSAAHFALTDLWPMIQEHIAYVQKERTRLGDALRSFQSLEVYPSNANFFLVRVSTDARRIATELSKEGIAVRHFSSERLSSHLRITVGTPEENDTLLSALKLCAT